jgi:hypothetical protein
MFVVTATLDTDDQRRIWRMFLRHALHKEWINNIVCVHGLELRFRGSLQALGEIVEDLKECKLLSEWLSEFDCALYAEEIAQQQTA